jgi:hypothetical protein
MVQSANVKEKALLMGALTDIAVAKTLTVFIVLVMMDAKIKRTNVKQSL